MGGESGKAPMKNWQGRRSDLGEKWLREKTKSGGNTRRRKGLGAMKIDETGSFARRRRTESRNVQDASVVSSLFGYADPLDHIGERRRAENAVPSGLSANLESRRRNGKRSTPIWCENSAVDSVKSAGCLKSVAQPECFSWPTTSTSTRTAASRKDQIFRSSAKPVMPSSTGDEPTSSIFCRTE